MKIKFVIENIEQCFFGFFGAPGSFPVNCSLNSKFCDFIPRGKIEKKDMVLFKRQYVQIIKNALSKGTNEYNVIDHLIGLDDFHRGRNISQQKVFVFHSLLPSNVDPNDKSPFDSSFVKVSQSSKLSDINLPNVIFVNPNRSKEAIKFWEDLKYNGEEEGLSISFNTEIID